MHYKTKSTMVILSLVVLMFAVAWTLSSVRQPSVTGASVSCDIACRSTADCYDGDACTIEECLRPFECDSVCSVTQITSCIDDDGCCPSNCQGLDNDC